MQCFSFVAITAILLAQAVHAAPASPETSALVASFPVSQLHANDAQANTTLPHGGLHVDAAQQTFPAFLLLCEATSCASCEELSLQALSTNLGVCFAADITVESVAIIQASNEGLPFVVSAAVTGCSSLLEIPTVNECFNIDDPTQLIDAFVITP
ncbi:hypothetical protein C2E23DRAFT_235085 [Lenzites betulinus]|nr:hypothetical protein C2E23DRAFT_235085 [Lenzites betulinus]